MVVFIVFYGEIMITQIFLELKRRISNQLLNVDRSDYVIAGAEDVKSQDQLTLLYGTNA